MVYAKLAALAVYLCLAYLAATQPLSGVAQLSIALLAVVVIAHLIECRLYRCLIDEAPGSSSWHRLQVLLFGLFHAAVMRRAIRSRYEDVH